MQIEIFSDVVCPWCFIGKRRLDRVLDGELGEGVQIVWRAYQLYPEIPAAGIPRRDFMRARFGSDAPASAIYERVLSEAKEEGLTLDFQRIEVAPNTLQAHRLLSWAEPSGRQHELAEQLFRSYFQEGRNVGDAEELVRAARLAGLDGDAAERLLDGHDELDKVRSELALAQTVGVSGVPFFVLGGRFAIPGAQPAEVMRQLIERARDRLAAASG
jgi:predicted DsbA family dithiol-disulfide isomerase